MVQKTELSEKELAAENGDQPSPPKSDTTPRAGSETDESKPRTTARRRSEKQRLREENQRLKAELEQAKEQIFRLSAELQNLKKRHNRELEEVVVYANQKFAEKLLPIVDDLERALHASDKHGNFRVFRNGVEMIYRNLLKTLEEEGVKPFKSIGQRFDYNLHEAVLAVHREGVEPGTVVDELQKGYMYRDRVLRHAKVVVSK